MLDIVGVFCSFLFENSSLLTFVWNFGSKENVCLQFTFSFQLRCHFLWLPALQNLLYDCLVGFSCLCLSSGNSPFTFLGANSNAEVQKHFSLSVQIFNNGVIYSKINLNILNNEYGSLRLLHVACGGVWLYVVFKKW